MQLILVNHNFERIGMIENASVIWATRYYQCGDFEIYTAATENNLNLINQAYFVVRDDDEDNVGIIEDFEITSTPEEGDMVTVTGRFAPVILGRRVISQQTQLYGNVQNNIRNLILTNVINPVNKARKIDYIDLADINDEITEKINTQTTGDNLLTKIEELCSSLGLGFRMSLKDNKIYFGMYKGVDRSYQQNENPWIIFSDDYDNLAQSKYSVITSSYQNTAYVAGEGEGLDRKIISTWNTTSEPTGDARVEVWVDQRNISSNDGDLTDEEVTEQMKSEGLENLIAIDRLFEGEVILQNYKYGKPKNGGHFFLGDIVSIYKKNWNLTLNVRIVEVIESIDENGKSITLTFGNI